MTRAPFHLASCTAMDPTPPDAAWMRTVCPCSRPAVIEQRLVSSERGDGDGGGVDRVESLGNARAASSTFTVA